MSRIKYIIAWALLLWLVALPVMAQDGGATTIMGRDYVLHDGDKLDNDLVVLGGQVRLEDGSTIIGDVTIMGGEAELSGLIQGDVVVMGGTATLGKTARIEGDVVVLGQLRRDPDATITGNLVQGAEAGKGLEQLPSVLSQLPGLSQISPSDNAGQGTSGVGRAIANLSALLLVLLVAALAIALAPAQLGRLRQAAFVSPLLSLGIGIVTTAVVAILIPILVVICIGIPIAIVAALAVLLAALFGWVAAGQCAGERLTAWLKLPFTSPLTQGLVGVFVISLLALIPCLGPVAAFLVISMGIGAVVLTRCGTMDYLPAPAAASAGAAANATPGGRDASTDAAATPAAPASDAPDTTQTRSSETRRLDPFGPDQGGQGNEPPAGNAPSRS